MTQAICDITTDEVNVDVVVEPQADTMVEVANRAGGMEQVFHDNTLIGNGNSVDLGVNTDIIATKEYSDEQDALLRNEINGKLTAIDSQIDANADAIQKTREDYVQADSEIHQILNNHASELTTLRGNQASMSNQVSDIEEKIPGDASATNQLATKADLKDINTAVATKQDKLTAGENITIVDNVISATGGGGGGITEVAHDDTLAGNGTTDSPLGLAETIKSEIAGKQKQLHPGTNVFINSVNPDYDIISVPNMVSSLNGLSGALSLQAGDGIAIDGLKISATGGGGTGTDDYTQLLNKPEINGNVLTGNKTASQLGFATVATSGNYSDLSNKPTINDLTTTAQQNAINSTITSSLVSSYSNHIADTDIHVTAEQKTAWTNKQDSLVSGTNIKTINNNSLLGSGNINIDSLPDQSGNAGKVLTTDGTTASWQEPAGGTKVIFREWE